MNQDNSDEKNGLNALTPTVSSVASVCHLAETGGGGIVPTPAEKQRQDNGRGHDVRLANTDPDKVSVKVCEICGRPYHTARPTVSKYCGASCKRRGWLAADPERAARVAASDRARLRAHFEARGLAWEERGNENS